MLTHLGWDNMAVILFRQAIIWKNDVVVYMHHMAWVG